MSPGPPEDLPTPPTPNPPSPPAPPTPPTPTPPTPPADVLKGAVEFRSCPRLSVPGHNETCPVCRGLQQIRVYRVPPGVRRGRGVQRVSPTHPGRTERPVRP
jgi:hypothetical protein